MSDGLASTRTSALVGLDGGHPVLAAVPPQTQARFWDFFGATLRNPNTRAAYLHAVGLFFDWCSKRELGLLDLRPLHVAGYIEGLSATRTAGTVKQHLAAIRGVLGYLVTGGALPFNPAADVKGPANVYRKGKSPVLFEDEARTLLDAIDTSHVVGLRDRAFIGVMLFSFARVSAVCGMRVRDYEIMGRRAHFVLEEKGGIRSHRVPAHHKAAAYVEAYIETAGIADQADAPLFRSSRGQSRTLTDKPLHRINALAMVKRRAKVAGFADSICNHSFRASAITAYMQNGGSLETAASIAGHASTRTTQLYNRNPERLELAEIERIRI